MAAKQKEINLKFSEWEILLRVSEEEKKVDEGSERTSTHV